MKFNLKKELKKRLDHPAVWFSLAIVITTLLTTSYLMFIVELPKEFKQAPNSEEIQEPISDITFSFESYDVDDENESVDIVMKVDKIREPQSANIAYYVGSEKTSIGEVNEGDTFAIKANYGENITVGYIDQNDSFVGVESFEAV